jgi:hypothetical protein
MTRKLVAGSDCAGLETVLQISLKQAIAIGKWLGCSALTAASLYILFWGIAIFLLSRDLYLRNIEDAAAENARGDRVFAETNFEGGETHPWRTLIWLKRNGHLFSTPLLEAYSYEVLVGLHWENQDSLVLQLDFGCDGMHSSPVEAVGPIHILYRFGDPGHLPHPGYESARRRDLPREPCD